jgi:hypothetical protein
VQRTEKLKNCEGWSFLQKLAFKLTYDSQHQKHHMDSNPNKQKEQLHVGRSHNFLQQKLEDNKLTKRTQVLFRFSL